MFGQTTDTLPAKSRQLFWAALILTIIGFVFTLIGVCMPFWTSITDIAHSGVFQTCTWILDPCSSSLDLDITYKDVNLMQLLWGLSIAGLLLLVLSLVLMITYPIHKTVNHCKIAVGIFVSIFLAIGVLLILVALIVYVDDSVWIGLSIKDAFKDIGWAWYLTLVGLIILVTGFICFILHMFFMMYGEHDSREPMSMQHSREPASVQQHYTNTAYFSNSKKY